MVDLESASVRWMLSCRDAEHTPNTLVFEALDDELRGTPSFVDHGTQRTPPPHSRYLLPALPGRRPLLHLQASRCVTFETAGGTPNGVGQGASRQEKAGGRRRRPSRRAQGNEYGEHPVPTGGEDHVHHPPVSSSADGRHKGRRPDLRVGHELVDGRKQHRPVGRETSASGPPRTRATLSVAKHDSGAFTSSWFEERRFVCQQKCGKRDGAEAPSLSRPIARAYGSTAVLP